MRKTLVYVLGALHYTSIIIYIVCRNLHWLCPTVWSTNKIVSLFPVNFTFMQTAPTAPRAACIMASQSTRELDGAVERVGFGRFQVPMLLATGLTWSGDAMEMSVMAYVLPVLQKDWGVTQAAADAFASVIFAGMLCGGLGWGIFSDAVGRRTGWLTTTIFTALAGILSAMTPSGAIGTFLTLRAFVGIGLAGTNLGFALATELLPCAARATVLMYFEFFFVGGSVLEVLLAWLILERYGWRLVLMLSTVPLWISLSLWRHVPESPRWLAAHGRTAEAMAVLERAAVANGRPPLVSGRGQGGVDEGSIGVDVGNGAVEDGGCDGGAADFTRGPDTPRLTGGGRCRPLALLLRAAAVGFAQMSSAFHPSLRLASAALCFGWFMLTFTYFGLVMLTPKVVAAAIQPHANATTTDVNTVFSRSLLATLSEVPGICIATVAIGRFGRVRAVNGCLLTLTVTLALMAACVRLSAADAQAKPSVMSPNGAADSATVANSGVAALLLGLMAVSRMAAMGGYSTLYVLTAETFPTRVRATGFGVVSASSRLAGTVTPFIAGSVWASSPSATLACYACSAALCAAVLGLCVPETGGQPLPDEFTPLQIDADRDGQLTPMPSCESDSRLSVHQESRSNAIGVGSASRS